MNKNIYFWNEIKSPSFWNEIKIKIVKISNVFISITFNDITYFTSSKFPEEHAKCNIVP